jgi:hypothetical protein
MKSVTMVLAGGAAIAALAGAAPAAAQFFPGFGSPYGTSPYGPGMNSQAAVGQCVNAVQARLGGGYGYGGYGYGDGRVLGISHVEQSFGGGLRVRGVASSGRYAGYGDANRSQVDLVWNCRTDFRGFVVGIDVHAAQPNYGYGYTPYNNGSDYSQYGYYRY